MLTFKEYSEFARLSDMYPRVTGVGGQILPVYPALAMMGEIGEVAEKLPAGGDGLLNEFGDVLWYVDAAARDLGLTLDEVVEGAIERRAFCNFENSIHVGSGDSASHALKLIAHASVFSERIKKYWRDGGKVQTDVCMVDLHGVLCQLHRVAVICGWNLESAARANMAKLASRRARGVVSGSGDNR